jgi:hypothetical protein
MALPPFRPAIDGGLREAQQNPSSAPFTGLLAPGFSHLSRNVKRAGTAKAPSISPVNRAATKQTLPPIVPAINRRA